MGRTTRTVVAAAITAGALVLPAAPAAAAPARGMTIEFHCTDGEHLTLTRSNGASWWDSSGLVYTTTALTIQNETYGDYSKTSGDRRPRPMVTCTGDHAVRGDVFVWTVVLAPSR